MIYKVYYQETKIRNPKREDTKSLYMEADKHLAYEQEHADFTLTEF